MSSYSWFAESQPALRNFGLYAPNLPVAAQEALAAHPVGRTTLSKNSYTVLDPDVWFSLWEPRTDVGQAGWLAGRSLTNAQLDWLVRNERRVQPLVRALFYNAHNEAWVRDCITGPAGPRLANTVDVALVATAGRWTPTPELCEAWARHANGDRRVQWLIAHHADLDSNDVAALLADPKLRINASVHTLTDAAQLLGARPEVVNSLPPTAARAVAMTAAASLALTDQTVQLAFARSSDAEVRFALAANPAATRATLKVLAGDLATWDRRTAGARLDGTSALPPGCALDSVSGDAADAAITLAHVPRGSWRGIWVPAQLYWLATLARNPNLTEAQIGSIAQALNGRRAETILGTELRNEIRSTLEATYPASPAAKRAGRAARIKRAARSTWTPQFPAYRSYRVPTVVPRRPAGPVLAKALSDLNAAVRATLPVPTLITESLGALAELRANVAWLITQPGTFAQWTAVLSLLEDASDDDDLVALFAAACAVA